MSEDSATTNTYALRSDTLSEIDPSDVPYRPPTPKFYRPKIGMIGTGGISNSHLDAYRTAGWEVAALWNRTASKAEKKAKEFYPTAWIAMDWRDVLADNSIEIVDITLPTQHRAAFIAEALKAGKHVLSQKPFVEDLDIGEELVALADANGVHLVVNQNGRWSPHMAWMRNAVRAGHIGELISAHISLHWNHGWTAGTLFDEIDDLVLYDFGIHWFDFLSSLLGDRVKSVFASASYAQGQANKVPLLAQSLVSFDRGQASLIFDGGMRHGPRDTTYLGGTAGSITSDGPDLGNQAVKLVTSEGIARPVLEGQWFNDGFRGAMGELLCAIEEDRAPENSARENLKSLALTFAAIHSRRTGREIAVGDVRRLDD